MHGICVNSVKDVLTEEENEYESLDGSSDEDSGDELAEDVLKGEVEGVLASVELECVDDLVEEENGDGEVYDDDKLLWEVEVLGFAVLMSKEWGGTEVRQRQRCDNDATTALGP